MVGQTRHIHTMLKEVTAEIAKQGLSDREQVDLISQVKICRKAWFASKYIEGNISKEMKLEHIGLALHSRRSRGSTWAHIQQCRDRLRIPWSHRVIMEHNAARMRGESCASTPLQSLLECQTQGGCHRALMGCPCHSGL